MSAVLTGTVITVVPEGSIPEGVRTVPDMQILPPLDRVRIQLLEASELRSETTHLVKKELASLYPGV